MGEARPRLVALPNRAAISPRSSGYSLHREGDAWTLAYRGVSFRLRDMKGLHHLARRLTRPGMRISATELADEAQEISRRPTEKHDKAPLRYPITAGERARLAVTQRIKAAVRKIAEHDRSFGHHVSTCIRTGASCVYTPDPENPIAWEIDEEDSR